MIPSFKRLIGVNRFVLSPQEYKRVLLTGQLTVVTFLVLGAFSLMDALWGYRYPIPINLVAMVLLFGVLLLNRRGYFMTARLMLAGIVTAITLFFTAVLDRTMGLFQFALCINIGVLTVFGYENLKWAISFAAITTVLYLIALFHPYPRLERIDLADPAYAERNLFFGFVIASAASVTVVYYLLKINHDSEASLLKKERSISAKNEELTEVNTELDRFFYSVSHDLRAPLTSMQGILNLMEQARTPEEIKEYAGLLKGRVENLDQFVRSVTAYAGNARREVASEPVVLRSVFREVLENMRYYPNAEAINVTLDIPHELRITSDPMRLQIIFGNLITNAIKYHDYAKPSPFIHIGCEVNETTLSVRIQDNGSGIHEDALPRIFEMFYRGNGSSQGSGLGLYIVKEALDKIGGHIEVTSAYGEGTTFVIRLPLRQAVA